jgi:outer membrane beta-barrel protein
MRKVTPLIIALLAVCAPATSMAAGITGPKKSALDKLEEGDAIRRRVQYRGGRFMVAPTFGFTLNDSYQRNILMGAALSYHFTESIGVGLSALASPFGGLDSDLAEQIGDQRPERSDDGFSHVSLLTSLDFLYTPIAGKLALFGRQVLNYDMHLVAGIGGAKIGGSGDLDAFTLAPVAGVGLRTFLLNWLDLNIEVRDYIYSSAANAVTSNETSDGSAKTKANDEWGNHFAVLIGVGFHFPMDPEIKR